MSDARQAYATRRHLFRHRLHTRPRVIVRPKRESTDSSTI